MPTRGRALLVDDDPAFIAILSRILEPFALTLDTCEKASEAILMLQGRDYALIFLDLRLKGSDGGTVIDFLKRSKPHQLSQTLVLTSYPGSARGLAPDLPLMDKGNLSALPERVKSILGE